MGSVRPLSGRFWDLQRRFQEGNQTRLGVVTCCELGFLAEQLLGPHLAMVWQNAGGTCEAVNWDWIDELVVLHHEGCYFQPDRGSLRREWQKLEAPGPVHLWKTEREWQRLRIYLPETDGFYTPFELAATERVRV